MSIPRLKLVTDKSIAARPTHVIGEAADSQPGKARGVVSNNCIHSIPSPPT